jgi:hypothetical protein
MGDAIVPFADFDGQRWHSNWPEPAQNIDTAPPPPPPLQQIPAAWWGSSTSHSTWEVLDQAGHRRTVKITGTGEAGMGSSCIIQVGLRTDAYPGAYEFASVLASDRPGVIDPVRTLTSSASTWRTVAALLPTIYKSHEASAWQSESKEYRPDLAAPLPKATLDAAFSFNDSQGEYLYFESSRTHPPITLDSMTYVMGWMWRRSAGSPFQVIDIRAARDNGDFKSVHQYRPLGVVRYGGRRFSLGFFTGYASMEMVVLELARNGIMKRASAPYGGC